MPAKPTSPARSATPSAQKPFLVAGVGASAGGLEAMRRLLASLGKNPGMAIVYVQHLDPSFESSLTELFTAVTDIPVVRAEAGTRLQRNHVYVAPPHVELRVEGEVLHHSDLHHRAEKAGPIDRFFGSLAQDLGRRAVGIILSGTLSDGSQGVCRIRDAGGVTFAQDEGSAKFDGMPKSAAATGCVDFVLPPEGIAAELKRMSKKLPAGPPGTGPAAPAGRQPRDRAAPEDERGDALQRILNLLWSATGTDFRGYKRDMVGRRVARRVEILRLDGIDALAAHLRDHPDAVADLYEDLLIAVTDFFRDSDLFRYLKTRIFPELEANRPAGTPIRVWVPGCSTGQEAYSLAIALLEHLGDRVERHPLQVFGTDLSDDAIERARAGLYSAKEVERISADRLALYFQATGGGYRISKRVRDLCIFARQNLLKDPPFSRMDLISCQNVLIYFDTQMQRRAIQVFHYALADRGFLVLGGSESTGAHPDLFSAVSKKYKVYQKRPSVAPVVLGFTKGDASPEFSARQPDAAAPAYHANPLPDLQREADRAVLAAYSPPGVLVNDRMEILQFRGTCTPYVDPSPGLASLSLFKMLNEDLGIYVRQLMARAAKAPGKPARQRVRAAIGGDTREIDLDVIAFNLKTEERPYFMVMFHELPPPDRPQGKAAGDPGKAAESASRGQKALLSSLHRELNACKEQLRSLLDESESKAEELRSAMEEVTSANEELQSINEELETAKEELQSTNEELTTVNDELQTRNVELSLLNTDIQNFIASVDIPILMLDKGLAIRRYTPSATALLNVIPGDVGRPLSDLRLKVRAPGLEAALGQVVASGEAQELSGKGGERSFTLWIRPYFGPDGAVDGAVIAFLDVTDQTRARDYLQAVSEGLRRVLDHMPAMLVAFDDAGLIAEWNEECERITGWPAAEVVGRPDALRKLFPAPGDGERRGSRDGEIDDHSESYRARERTVTCKDGRVITVAWSSVGALFPISGWSRWEIGVPVDGRPTQEAYSPTPT